MGYVDKRNCGLKRDGVLRPKEDTEMGHIYSISLVDPRSHYWKQGHKEIPDKIQSKQDHQSN